MPGKTLVFSTSFADDTDKWERRWGRWLKYVASSGLRVDQILIVDDGSPVLPAWPGVIVASADQDGFVNAPAVIRTHATRLGKNVNGEPFPGWYRSFGHACRYAMDAGFDKIIHIESDAYLLSDRIISYCNELHEGWIGFWSGKYNFPESAIQIVNRDQFAACRLFFDKAYSQHLYNPHIDIERLIPFTKVNKTFIGDRYGERPVRVPYVADFVTQVPVAISDDYFWWVDQQGKRNMDPLQTCSYSDLVIAYESEPSAVFRHSGVDYRDFFGHINELLSPQSYLEIGTETGASVSKFTCNAVMIDPNFKLEHSVIGKRERSLFFQMTSDDFFEKFDPRLLIGPIDIGFLDGLHHFEALLRDFINFERHAYSGSMAVLHDCLPLNVRMAGRVHEHGPEAENADTRLFWTGDVWRLIPILKEYRPDLEIIYVDCPPTGLVLCAKLNPRSLTLAMNYHDIVEKYGRLDLDDYGLDQLWRLYPTVSSRQIIKNPDVFSRFFSLGAEIRRSTKRLTD